MTADKELERTLKAVANRKRIAILRYLKSDRASVGEIAKSIKLSIKATSHHLQKLAAAGYVTSEQQGLYVYYKIEAEQDAARVLKVIQ